MLWAASFFIAPEFDIEEGIYEFVAASGKAYVGQTGRAVSERVAEHLAAERVSADAASSTVAKHVAGGKLAREIAEQRRIDELGGIEKLENQRNPIGQRRRHLMR